jgi:serine protease Do
MCWMTRFAGSLFWMVLHLGLAHAEGAELPDFRALVRENSPAVVNISTVREPGMGGAEELFGIPIPDLPEDSPLSEFFKRFFEDGPGGPRGRSTRSLGSGFIISEDGYILTNAHVVADAEVIIVHLSDHREKPASVIGGDERSDVALLKIDATGLPTVRIGDSDRLEVGEWVLAIGSPFGLEHTATQGIVSALGRSLPGETYVPFIQTDAAVNPGNSGGPLFDTEGRAVGLNAQIFSDTGGYMGLSFAIPINVAMDVVAQLKNQGEVTYGWLGVQIQALSQDLAESFQLQRPRGALVAGVTPDSPAQRAGVRPGDIILSYDGQELQWYSELPRLVGATPAGRTVPLVVSRNGKTVPLKVTIGKLEDTGLAVAQTASEAVLGLRVTDLSAQMRRQMDLEQGGVLVEGVEQGPAAAAGIREGDVIVMINRQEVQSSAQLEQLADKLPREKPIPVLIQRGDGPIFLALRIPQE